MRSGAWWACLGVGPYAFAPYKVAWSAYGSAEFAPRVFGRFRGRSWQGNQALHAYLPCSSLNEARRLRRELARPGTQEYLESFRMRGTRSWAQPGRIARLFRFDPPPPGPPLSGNASGTKRMPFARMSR